MERLTIQRKIARRSFLAGSACWLGVSAASWGRGWLASGGSPSSSSFTVIALPDTQAYTKLYPEIFTCQTKWVRENKDKENIVFVVHEGDITDNNNEVQWQRARESMSILDGVVPYSLCPGNHDMGPSDAPKTAQDRDTTLFNKYFPIARYEKEPWYGGHLGSTNDNAYYFFNAGGMKFMVIALEFGPRDETLEWANRIVSEHPEARVLVLTHAYLFCDDTRIGPNTPSPQHCYAPRCYGCGGNDGEQIWEKFVKRHANLFLVLCGHVAGITTENPHPDGRLTSTGIHGNPVHQLLANYQWIGKGGDGWLRLMKFVPSENRIYVRTYSPYLKAFRTGPDSQLELDYAMSRSHRPLGIATSLRARYPEI